MQMNNPTLEPKYATFEEAYAAVTPESYDPKTGCGDDEWETAVKDTFDIPVEHLPELKERFAALAKKAKKLGCVAPSYEIVDYKTVTFKDEHPVTGMVLLEPIHVQYAIVKVSGEAPKYAGWTFIGTIEHIGEGVNLVKSIPGVDLDHKYRTLPSTCDHCHTTRRRNNTYVCRHEDGREVRVGSSCVGDFLGEGSPERIAASLEWLFRVFREIKDDCEEGGAWGRVTYTYDVEGVAAVTSAIIRADGWVSWTKARETGETPTSAYVAQWLSGTDNESAKYRKEVPVTDDDREIAKRAVEWALGIDLTKERSDYFYNLQTIIKMERVGTSRFGTLCSLVPTYRRHIEKETAEKAKTEATPSEFVGTIGKRQDFELLFTGAIDLESDWGPLTLYKFVANGKDQVCWFSSAGLGYNRIEGNYRTWVNVVEGSRILVKGTVKEHEDYKGTKQTKLSRVKLVKVLAMPQ